MMDTIGNQHFVPFSRCPSLRASCMLWLAWYAFIGCCGYRDRVRVRAGARECNASFFCLSLVLKVW